MMKTNSPNINKPFGENYNGLYIHVPFCRNICDYCALYSVVNNDNSVREQYLTKIKNELSKNQVYLGSLNSIFIGGGTPSQLSPEELTKFLSAISDFTVKNDNCEFTMECNPGTVTEEKFAIMKKHEVNRLSFGAQSTTSKTRNTLGRRTSHRQLLNAIQMAQDTGFENINIDLIYGIPGQELTDWQEDLETATKLKLPHYSAYSLILEEGTVLASKFTEVDDEAAVLMYDEAEAHFSREKLHRYEISNYAAKGRECRHNYDIWKGKTYLGIGPAACSFDGYQRWTEIADLKKWLDDEPAELDYLEKKDRLAEIVAFGFRTVYGWKKQELKDMYGSNTLEIFGSIFSELLDSELLVENSDEIKASPKGLLFADTIAEAFL
jgi:oxygen-independent coproporphyrinogen III oxidase